VLGLCIPKAGKLGGSRAFFVLSTRGSLWRRKPARFQNHVNRLPKLFSKLLLDAIIRNQYDFVKYFVALFKEVRIE